MECRKLDAALQVALSHNREDSGHQYHVFIHTEYPIGEKELQLLQDLGISHLSPDKKIFTATLPAESLSVLSDQNWVLAIRLSRRLRITPSPHSEDFSN
jgi:hypothetical protein